MENGREENEMNELNEKWRKRLGSDQRKHAGKAERYAQRHSAPAWVIK